MAICGETPLLNIVFRRRNHPSQDSIKLHVGNGLKIGGIYVAVNKM